MSVVSWMGAVMLSAAAGPLPVAVHETTRAAEAETAGALVTLHVFLQVHAASTLEGPRPTEASTACQEQVEAGIRALHDQGRLRSVVAEGLMARGSASVPRAVTRVAPENPAAAARLVAVPGLEVYGLEQPDVSSWGQAQLEGMRVAAEALEALAASSLSEADKQAELARIERSLYGHTTRFSAGDMPLRSFQGIQRALAIAGTYGQPEVALILGKQHAPDVRHAVAAAERLGSGRYGALRVVTYTCEGS